MRRTGFFFLAVLLLSTPVSAAWRRPARRPVRTAAAAGSIYELVAFEGGITAAYGLSPAGIGHGRTFAVSIPIGSKTEAGYVRISGDGASLPAFNLLRLSVYAGNRTGFHFYSGADSYNELTAGLAFFWDISRDTSGPRLKHAFRLELGYLYENGTGSPGAALFNLTLRFGY